MLRTPRAVLLLGLTVIALAALGLSVAPAYAQNIIVSGDSNIINGLNGSDVLTVNAGNQRFFQNALGGGTNVVIQNSTVGQTEDGVNLDSVLNTYYNGLGGGVSSSQFTGLVTSASLAGSNLFISTSPDTAYTAPEISALSSFINGGGTVFLLGENANFTPTQDANINADLTALGSSIRLTADSIDAGVNTVGPADIFANSLTTGVSSFEFAFTTKVTGGTTLVTDASSNRFVATQNLNPTSSVPEPASVATFGVGALVIAGLMLKARRRKSISA